MHYGLSLYLLELVAAVKEGRRTPSSSRESPVEPRDPTDDMEALRNMCYQNKLRYFDCIRKISLPRKCVYDDERNFHWDDYYCKR